MPPALLPANGRKQCARILKRNTGDIVAVISSYRGSDEAQRGLCYDQHHGWMVTVVVTLPETRPCGLRGDVGPVGKGSASPALLGTIQPYGISRRLCRSISCSAQIPPA